jgi:DNA (cytosine-5)-methyltransferase 1
MHTSTFEYLNPTDAQKEQMAKVRTAFAWRRPSSGMRVLDLFSGIGGWSLGLERAGGFKTIAFCEVAPFQREILSKHWPGVPLLGDVETADFPAADVITAGWPCQDISLAGSGAGLTGSRSGLWWSVVRAVRLVRPRWVLLENVAELLGRGMGGVVGALASCGYDAEYDCIPALSIGANHERDRAWIVAYDRSIGLAIGERIFSRQQITDAAAKASGRWDDLSEVGRAVHGLPDRVHRIEAIGNSLLPQIPEMIGRRIMAIEAEKND